MAGLHRLLASADELAETDAVVVVAGMEGALASLVGGITPAPVVAVPTSKPLLPTSWIPGGRVPGATDQLSGGVAFAASRAKAYDAPTVVAGGEVVAIEMLLLCTVNW